MTDVYEKTDSSHETYYNGENQYYSDWEDETQVPDDVYFNDEYDDYDDYYMTENTTGKRQVLRLVVILIVILLVVGAVAFGLIPYVQSLIQPTMPPLPPPVQT